jgi:hypothetical protein
MPLPSNALKGFCGWEFLILSGSFASPTPPSPSPFSFFPQAIWSPGAIQLVAMTVSLQKTIGIPFGSLNAPDQCDDIQIISCLFILDVNGWLGHRFSSDGPAWIVYGHMGTHRDFLRNCRAHIFRMKESFQISARIPDPLKEI